MSPLPGSEVMKASKLHMRTALNNPTECPQPDSGTRSEREEIFHATAQVPLSAIYEKLHGADCAEKATRAAFWRGDVFPVCATCSTSVQYRFVETFASAQADWEKKNRRRAEEKQPTMTNDIR